MTSAGSKLSRIREELNHQFVERAELIDGALTALLAANHVLIIGPPGTAKSMLANELCGRILDAGYFQWLLTKFSTPEEIFGAVSLRGLEHDDYRRVTTHKLPEAHIAFLDEIFKANSSILNALLTIINERVFHNGRERTRVPLITMFGASNELPDEDELIALYDRFMLRFMVEYINEDFRFLKMLEGTAPDGERTTLSFAELNQLQAAVRSVNLPGRIVQTMADLRRTLGREEIVVSDRRWKNCLGLMRAHAVLAGRSSVTEDDLMFLEHALWKDPEERPKVADALHQVVKGYEDEARELLIECRELREYAARSWESRELKDRARAEAHAKVSRNLVRIQELIHRADEAGRSTVEVRDMQAQVREIQQAILREM